MYVWKYEIPITDEFEVEMPSNSRILCVQTQLHNSQQGIWEEDIPCIWVVTDGNKEQMSTRRFVIIGTGHPFNPEPLQYIGTFQQYNGGLVWHLFEQV